MVKMILADGSGIMVHEEMHEGGPGAFTFPELITDVDSYGDLEELSGKLTVQNLKSVKFATGDGWEEIISSYEDMELVTNPKFQVSEGESGGLEVTFSIRQRSQEEMLREGLEQELAEVQLALVELYEAQG